MRELKYSTKTGKKIFEMGNRCTAFELSELYDKYSEAKRQAYEKCFMEFADDDNSTTFRVGNANTFGFTASWHTWINGEHAMRVETKDNSYLVWLDR